MVSHIGFAARENVIQADALVVCLFRQFKLYGDVPYVEIVS
jgi:hypothetical protein